jgi:hypothetical protein
MEIMISMKTLKLLIYDKAVFVNGDPAESERSPDCSTALRDFPQ